VSEGGRRALWLFARLSEQVVPWYDA
jgi:hypothetical protein